MIKMWRMYILSVILLIVQNWGPPLSYTVMLCIWVNGHLKLFHGTRDDKTGVYAIIWKQPQRGGFIQFVMGGGTKISLIRSLSHPYWSLLGGGGGCGIHPPYGLDKACAQHCAGKDSTIIGDCLHVHDRRDCMGEGNHPGGEGSKCQELSIIDFLGEKLQ